MKLKILKNTILVSLVALCAVASGCGESNEQSSQQETTQATTQTAVSDKDSIDSMADLIPTDVGTNDFAGIWKITNSDNDEISKLQYIFDGDQRANLVMDNMGYLGTYTVKSNVMACQLMFGLNGTYAYEKSGNKLTLTEVSTQEEVILEKCETGIIPEAPQSAEIDEALLGAWKDETGEYYYFDKSGLMYDNQYGIMCTFFTYTAKDGKISAEYTMEDKQTDTYTYVFEDDTLILNGSKMEKLSDKELLDYLRGGYKEKSTSMSE